jgi:DNA-binding beta-propeller fold protein YncE
MLRIALAAAVIALAAQARADVVVSANDNHTTVIDGKPTGQPNARPDTISLIDVARFPPRVAAEFEAPNSDIGPPFAIAVARDESFAIVTCSTKADPQAPGGTSYDDRVSVIDLKSSPPRVIQTLHAGPGVTTVRISPDGRMVLTANRFEGTVSIFTLAGKTLTPVGKFDFGSPKGQPVGMAFAHDGRTVLVSRMADNLVSVLHVDGTTLSLDSRPITTGVTPYTMDANPAGTLAAVANGGRGDGDLDTVSLIDLTQNPPRTVDSAVVPSGPEGLHFSPDGKFLAVTSINGSIKSDRSPFYHPGGILTLFALRDVPGGAATAPGGRLRWLASAPVGGWAQGVAFSRDGRAILVQNMKDHAIAVFRWSGARLTPGAPLTVSGGAAGIGTAW